MKSRLRILHSYCSQPTAGSAPTDALSKLRELLKKMPHYECHLKRGYSCERCEIEALLPAMEQRLAETEKRAHGWHEAARSQLLRSQELYERVTALEQRELKLRESLEWVDREWQIFYKHLPDGEYEGLGMLRAALRAALNPTEPR